MASIVTPILLLVLAIHLVLAADLQVRGIGDVVGGIADNLVKTVVCLEQNALNLLMDLLNGLSLNSLSTILGSILTALLSPVSSVLQQILGLVTSLVKGLL